MKVLFPGLALLILATPETGVAQVHDHATMDHSTADATAGTADPLYAASTDGSGTTRLPGNEGPMRGHHIMAGEWMLMVHGAVSAEYTKVTGPRGDDKLYATSMAMLNAERQTD
jgi:hypothetical protein